MGTSLISSPQRPKFLTVPENFLYYGQPVPDFPDGELVVYFGNFIWYYSVQEIELRWSLAEHMTLRICGPTADDPSKDSKMSREWYKENEKDNEDPFAHGYACGANPSEMRGRNSKVFLHNKPGSKLPLFIMAMACRYTGYTDSATESPGRFTYYFGIYDFPPLEKR